MDYELFCLDEEAVVCGCEENEDDCFVLTRSSDILILGSDSIMIEYPRSRAYMKPAVSPVTPLHTKALNQGFRAKWLSTPRAEAKAEVSAFFSHLGSVPLLGSCSDQHQFLMTHSRPWRGWLIENG